MASKASFHGPLFDGRLPAVLDTIADDIATKLGTEGHRRVLANLDESLRKPTGAYRKRVTLNGPYSGHAYVHDRMGIYGPWLEGTGSRNQTTRFKGYASFRRAAQQLDRGAVYLAEHVIAQHIAELGG